MISILQQAWKEHPSAGCGWFPKTFRFRSFRFWEYWVSLYSLCFKGEFQRFFEWLYMCFTDLPGTTCVLGHNYKVRDLATDKVHWENQNHDWSKKWLQLNSRYIVKLITKGGFITASRSKELCLQRQLQIKFTGINVTNNPLKHNLLGIDSSTLQGNFLARILIFFFWVNNVSDISFLNSEQACLMLCRLHAA